MIKQWLLHGSVSIFLGMATVATSASTPDVMPTDTLSYADLADLALPAQIVAKVQILEAIEVKSPTQNAQRVGHAQLYITAQITDLYKGPRDASAQITYLADVERDARGHVPKLKKSVQLIFARPVTDHQGVVQLDAPDAEILATPSRESTVRAILMAETAPDSPPKILGLDNGFSVPGTIPGERESQIFLRTSSSPVSLIIQRHANEAPHWFVALGEIVNNEAPPPPKDSLLWYALACALPAHLPDEVLAKLSSDQAQALREDYDVVMTGLGMCSRNRRH